MSSRCLQILFLVVLPLLHWKISALVGVPAAVVVSCDQQRISSKMLINSVSSDQQQINSRSVGVATIRSAVHPKFVQGLKFPFHNHLLVTTPTKAGLN